MKAFQWWYKIPLFLRLGLLWAALFVVLQFLTLPSGIRIIYLFFALLGILLYVALEDQRIRELVSFFQDDSPATRRLRLMVLVVVPVLVGIATLRALLPSYPPPFHLFTLHPTPPERVWQTPVPSWVTEWRAEDIARGKTIYEANCAYCHGKELDGRGPAAAGLQYPRSPVSFKDPGSIATLTLPYVYWKVSEGGLQNQFNSAMPAWGVGVYAPQETVHTGDLSPDEIWRAIQYIYRASGREPAEF